MPQTPSVTTGLTTEMLASPIEGVAPALHTASSPWHTDMAAVRLDGLVAPLTSVRPLPQAAAATSQKKVKETVTQKSWEEQRDRKHTQEGPMIPYFLSSYVALEFWDPRTVASSHST